MTTLPSESVKGACIISSSSMNRILPATEISRSVELGIEEKEKRAATEFERGAGHLMPLHSPGDAH
jgi:hypothetical protein